MSDIDPTSRGRAPGGRLRAFAGLVRGCLLASAGALAASGMLGVPAQAAPQGGKVVSGSGSIATPDPATTLVQQSSHALAIDWQAFDVAAGEKVRFQQPSSSSAVLNRVLNRSPSQIHGALEANGQVFILNASGVVFGRGARVDVGGLVVSSLDLSDQDFMAGRYRLHARDGESPGAIVNRGLIRAARGGSVTLLGGEVRNEGVIVADAGQVNLASGRTATLDFDGDGLIRFEVDGEVLENAAGAEAAVSNTGEIRAEGGQVLLSARAAGEVFDRAVNNSGLVRAGSVERRGGRILLTGSGAGVTNTGTLDASGTAGGEVRMVSDVRVEQHGTVRADGAAGGGGRVHLASRDTTLLGAGGSTSARSEGGAGGVVEALGRHVGIVERAQIDASGATGGGRVLIGGDFQGANPEVANATRTHVGADTRIRADATRAGDGGTVIVWADEITRFQGAIHARGGERGGDGGFVEVSGKQGLSFAGTVDTRAPQGATGTLLLDPKNIFIADGGADTVADNDAFGENAATDATFDADQIAAALVTSSVVLQANNDIWIQEDIVGPANANALTLQAGRHVVLAQNVTIDGAGQVDAGATTGAVTVTLEGGDFVATVNDDGAQVANRDAGAAELFMAAGSAIVTNGGNVDLSSGTLDKAGDGATLSADVGAFTLASITTDAAAAVAPAPGGDAGDVSVTTPFAITAGSISAAGGDADSAGGNALAGGAGGAVALTASDATGTLFVGTITATGGAASDADATGTDAGGGAGGAVTLDTGGGAITLDASTIDTRGGAGVNAGVQGAGGNVAVNDAAVLANGAVSITTGASAGNITFGGPLDGTQTLGLTAGSGNASFAGAVGAGTPLGPVTVSSAGDVTLSGSFASAGFTQLAGTGTTSIDGVMTQTGDVGITTGTVDLGAAISAAGQAVALTAAGDILETNASDPDITAASATLEATAGGIATATTLETAVATLSASGAAGVNVANTGAVTATLNSGGGAVVFANTDTVATGDAWTGNSFDVDAGGTLTVNAGHTLTAGAGPLALATTAGDIVLNAALSALGQAVSLDAEGAVTGDANGTITTSAAGGSGAAAGDVTIDGATGVALAGAIAALGDGAGAGGAVNVDAGAGGVSVASIDASGGGGASSGGTIALNATGAGDVTLAGDLTTAGGTIEVGQALILAADATLSTGTTGGTITLGGAVDGAFALAVNTGGTTTFTGVVGGATPLASLITDAGGTTAIDGGAVTTTGAQTFGDAVTLGDGTTLSSGATVSFQDTVAGGGNNLTIAGDAAFDGAVSTVAALLVTGTTDLGGDVTTSAAQSYQGAVTLSGGARTVASTGTGTIDFGSAVDGAFALAVNTGGTTSFGGVVGGAMPLASLATDAVGTTALDGGAITSAGAQVYGDAVTLGAGTTLSSAATVSFQDTVTGGSNDLTIAGDAAFDGAVSTVAALLVTGATDLGGDVTTTAGQSYQGAVTLSGGARSVSSIGNGAISFGSTLDGAFALDVNTDGATTFTGVVGGAAPLASLVTDAGGSTAINGGALTTGGAQTYGDAVTVNQATTLEGSALNLPGSLSSAGNPFTLLFDDAAITGSIDAGAGVVTFDTDAGGRDVDLGTETANELSLTAAELAAITAGTLRIGQLGGPSNGGITVSAVLTAPGAGILALRSTGAVDDAAGAGSLSVAALGVDAGGPVTLDGANDVDTLAIDAAGAIAFTDVDAFQIATVDAIAGIDSGGATTTLDAGGTISQAPGANVIARLLEVETSAGSVTLANAGNDVDELIADADDDVAFTDADDLTIPAADEVSGNVVTLTAGTTLTLAGDVEGDASVTLSSGGDLTAPGGIIDTPELAVASGGIADLDDSLHSVASLTGSSAGDLGLRTNQALVASFDTNGGAASLTTTAGSIGGGTLTTGAGAVTLDAATGIGAINLAATGNLTLTANGGGSAGNITVRDTSGAQRATSSIALATPGTGTQAVSLRSDGGFRYDTSPGLASTLTTDNLTLVGNTTLAADPGIAAGSRLILQGITTLAGGARTVGGAGGVSFNGAVNGAGNDLTVNANAATFTGNITMGAGDILRLNSPSTQFTGSTDLVTDNLLLGGGPGSIDGTGSLTILRRSASAADTTIGGTDPLFRAQNVAALNGFAGTLGIGGTRTTPPAPEQLLNDIVVGSPLATAGDVFLVGAGDVTFNSGSGSITTPGTVSVVALGSSAAPGSGNILDTNAGISASGATPKVLAANTVELLAANQIGEEGGAGDTLNVAAVTVSAAQGLDGDAQVDRIGGTATGSSVLEVLEVYRLATGAGGALAGLINTAFVDIGGTAELTTISISTPKQTKGELGFIDEGVFFLPPAFTNPERAVLMPLLGDPDFPSDLRPQDPDDAVAWGSFFEDVVRPFIASRYPLPEDASAQQRAAVEERIRAELALIVEYYDRVRERERGILAREEALREDGTPPAEPPPDGEGGAPAQPTGAPPAASASRPAPRAAARATDHVGQPWHLGGIGVAPRGRQAPAGPWPQPLVPRS